MDANSQTGESTPSAQVMEIPSEPAAREKWLATGEKYKPATDGNAEPVKTSSSPDKGEGVPASETGEKEQGVKNKSKAQQRLDEILEDIKTAGFTPAELKTYRREQKAAQVQAAPEATVKPPERPKRPKMAEFYDKEDPQAAYETAMDEYESKCRSLDRQETIAEIQRTQSEQNSRRELLTKVNEAKTKYGEEAQAVISKTVNQLFSDNQIPLTVKAIIDESPVMVELLYGIGAKPEEFASFLELARNQPGQSLRKLVLMENGIIEGEKTPRNEAPKGEEGEGQDLPERDDKGQFISRKVSKAPPPPLEMGGTKGQAPDEVEAAVKAGNFAAYQAAQNARDAARFLRK
jgi:hypothetical protein